MAEDEKGKRKLFDEDYTFLVYKHVTGKKIRVSDEDQDNSMHAEEAFLIRVGTEEVDKLCFEIDRFIENTEDLVISDYIVDYLKKQKVKLQKVRSLIRYELDRIKIIATEGIEQDRRLMKYRRDLLNRLAGKYEGGKFQS